MEKNMVIMVASSSAAVEVGSYSGVEISVPGFDPRGKVSDMPLRFLLTLVGLSGWFGVISAGNSNLLKLTYYLPFLMRSRSCLLYTSPSPRDATLSRMPSSA